MAHIQSPWHFTYTRPTPPNEQETLTLRWFHSGPPSTTLAQHETSVGSTSFRPLGYERVYLAHYKVENTPFRI